MPWTEFDSANNTGHFFPIELAEKYQGEAITVTGAKTKTAEDRYWVLRVENSKNNTFEFTAGGEKLFNLDFGGAIPTGEKAFDPTKKDFGSYGKWTDYCDENLQIKWNGVKGTVTGKIKHHDAISDGKVKAGNHFPLGLAAYYFDGVPKTITVGSGKPKTVKDKDIICDVSAKPASIKVGYNGVTVLELDLSGAEIEAAGS